MAGECISVTTVIDASAEAVFAVLADPAQHVTIDGTGWVREAVDRQPLVGPGQIFRMAMYHENHPDRDYQMVNELQVFDPPRAISWKPGYDTHGGLEFGGWIWRYDLDAAAPSQTRVTLSYDWSAVPAAVREHLQLPPFPPEHLTNSLAHLAKIVTP